MSSRPSVWDFKTIKENGFIIQEIEAELYSFSLSHQTRTLYNDYVDVYKNSGLDNDNIGCNADESCMRVLGDISGAPVGYIDNIRLFLKHTKFSIQENTGGKTDFYRFSADYRYARRKASVQAQIKPAIKKPNTQVRKKK